MQTSQEIDKLSLALTKAQASFSNVAKKGTAKIRTKTGGEYSYKFAGLPAVLDAIRKPLADNQLCITQGLSHEATNVIITTRLIHSSGQWMESSLGLPIVDTGNNAIQAIGATITYGRRYALTALLGIASEDDSDASYVKMTLAKEKKAEIPVEVLGACNEKEILPAKREAMWASALTKASNDAVKAKEIMLAEIKKIVLD
jgi:hypothetical protein